MKRLFDILVSFFGGLFFLPFAIIFAIAVKLEDGGSIFYIQERWGKGSRKFRAFKFRSMRQDADKQVGFKPAEQNDPRVTKVGHFLRATAMDELPQLINILIGDMSFVGPRALAIQEVEPSEPRFHERHAVQPGLTGPAQIFASRDSTLQQKFDYDLRYIKEKSFFLDIKLMFMSLWVTLSGKWESRKKKI